MSKYYSINHKKINNLIHSKKKERIRKLCSNGKPTSSLISLDDMIEFNYPSVFENREEFVLLDDDISEFNIDSNDDIVNYTINNDSFNGLDQLRSQINYDYFTEPKNINTKPLSYLAIFSQLLISSSISLFFYNNWIIVNMLTIDSIYGSIVFLTEYYQINYQKYFYQEIATIRYFYYIFALTLYYNLTWITWFPIYFICPFYTTIFTIPYTINIVSNIKYFQKIYYFLYNEIDFLFKFIFSKKIASIINYIGINHLQSYPNLKAMEIVNNINQLSLKDITNFIFSSIIASVLFYFELDGTRFYTILFRQYYFKQYFLGKNNSSNISDRSYILQIIQQRNWKKLIEPYSLNRLMKLYLQINQSSNGGIFFSQSSSFEQIKHSIGCFMLNWTVYSIIGYRSSGIWTYCLLIWKHRHNYLRLRISLIGIFLILSFICHEQVLLLLILELTMLVTTNQGFFGLLKDLKEAIFRECEYYLSDKKPKPRVFTKWELSIFLGVWLTYTFFYNFNFQLIQYFIYSIWIIWLCYRSFIKKINIIGLILNLYLTISNINPFHFLIINLNYYLIKLIV